MQCSMKPRITPAYAGKSGSPIRIRQQRWDHPRLCGEKSRSDHRLCGLSGITPAYAGKRESTRLLSLSYRDHPRLCGEKFSRVSPSARTSGSPPPMRGKGDKFLTIFTTVRITPAYAGKRDSTFLTTEKIRDHPRLCGEKFTNQPIIKARSGSPPPMRGKGYIFVPIDVVTRITPAYAGKRNGHEQN